MKEPVEITREPDPSSTRSSVQDIAIQADAKAYVKVCDECQRFSNIPRQPSEYLTPITAP